MSTFYNRNKIKSNKPYLVSSQDEVIVVKHFLRDFPEILLPIPVLSKNKSVWIVNKTKDDIVATTEDGTASFIISKGMSMLIVSDGDEYYAQE